LRVALMSSYTARTSALACSYSINPRVDMKLLIYSHNSPLIINNAFGDMNANVET
jgi:hypothetical protein